MGASQVDAPPGPISYKRQQSGSFDSCNFDDHHGEIRTSGEPAVPQQTQESHESGQTRILKRLTDK